MITLNPKIEAEIEKKKLEDHFSSMGHGQRLKLFKKSQKEGVISEKMTFDEFDKSLPKKKLGIL